jgi:hypothetical protein
MFATLRTMAACAAVATLALAVPAQGGDVGNHATFSPPTKHFSDGAAIHFYQTPEQRARSGLPPMQKAGAMEYFGGSVFSNVKVVVVFWGPNVTKTTVQGIGAYFTAITNSTFVDQLAGSNQYDTERKGVNGHRGTNQDIGRGTLESQVQITPKNKNTTVTDDEVNDEIAYQIGKGKLPANDPNTLYMIYFPANVTITAFGLTSCVQFGAYHFASITHPTARNIFYGVEPECGGGFVSQTIISAHEYAEATTDNIPTPGTVPAYPQAWNDANGNEIGDLCEGTQGTLTAGSMSWQVQEVYLNTKSGCGTGNFHSP